MKVKGGTLFLVLIVALVIAVLSSSIIMLSYYNKIQVFNNTLYQKLKCNVDSGLNILASSTDTSFASDGVYIDLYGQGTDSVYLKKQNWGIYEQIVAAAKLKDVEVKSQYLLGHSIGRNHYAIYLANLGRSLSLCGDTKIIGDIYIPESGVRREYSPVPFSGTKLFEGQQHKSDYALPKIKSTMISNIISLSESQSENYIAEANQDSLYRSFSDERTIINIGKKQHAFPSVKGNVIIVSDTAITIKKEQLFEDAIIIARSITIEDGFEGVGQFYAFDSIRVKANVKLRYPSVLGLIKIDYNTQRPFIKVDEYATVKGVVFATHKVQDLMGTYIKVGKHAQVEGEIIAEGFLEVNGTVFGSVTANKFMLNTSSSVYENYLMDAEINYPKRSAHYVSSSLVNTETVKRIVKCLY